MLHQHSNIDLYVKIRSLAREMRKHPTEAEEFFWEKVRDRRLFGLKWNRQFVIQCQIDSGCSKFYIPDFHCHKYKLITELDGQIHLKLQDEDQLRTEQLIQRGFSVIRFTNDQILKNWNEVEQCIWDHTLGLEIQY